MEIANKINQLNDSIKETKKMNELKEEEWYNVLSVKRTKNNFNKNGSILIESDEFCSFLPNRYGNSITDEDLEEWKNNNGKEYNLVFKVSSVESKKYGKIYKVDFSTIEQEESKKEINMIENSLKKTFGI